MTNLKTTADRILYEFGLLHKLEEFGKPHIIGSYRMDMMAWNDLDIDIENDTMSLEKLYELTAWILDTFHPVWYEAKEVTNENGEPVWFHGFETTITGELWNLDLWFQNRETIAKAEAYCDNIATSATPDQKESIQQIKKDLIARGLYSFEQYKSMDVYEAVLQHGVRHTEEFLIKYKKIQ